MEKRMVIMGATSGIGRKVAELYIGRGWRVGVAGRRVHLLEELKRMNPDRVEYEPVDVTGTCSEESLLRLIERLGGMDVYFHCSGIGHQNMNLDADTELATVQTNSIGFTRMVGAAFRYFAEKGTGHIAVVSSIAGTKGLGVAPAYSATKRFQNIYIQSLAQLARMKHYDISFTDTSRICGYRPAVGQPALPFHDETREGSLRNSESNKLQTQESCHKPEIRAAYFPVVHDSRLYLGTS